VRAGGRPPAERGFPLWGALAVPGGLLWGATVGLFAGAFFGNAAIGAAIGAGLGIGVGFALFAAAVVVASAGLSEREAHHQRGARAAKSRAAPPDDPGR
jgi:hypothetical protein